MTNPHMRYGTGTQVGILTLWTKKEHVLTHIPEELYAIASQLYSRDEGISQLMRGLLKNPQIRDIIMVGADLNKCSDTLLALWEHGAQDGRVIGAPGYIDTELPAQAIDTVRAHVTLHDLRTEKDYANVAAYIKALPKKEPWGAPQEYPQPTITPPTHFPTGHQHAIRHDSIERASVELAHLLARFGALANVHVHLTQQGTLPSQVQEQEETYTTNVLENLPGTYGEHLHKKQRLARLVQQLTQKQSAVITFGDDVEEPLLDLVEVYYHDNALHLTCHLRTTTLGEFPLLASAMFSLLTLIASELDEPAGTVTITTALLTTTKRYEDAWSAKPHILRRQGDPKSNLLIRIRQGRIWITHLSPHGKRLEEFSAENAREAYKRLVVEHRITDLSHAAYAGYELAKAEHALKTGGMYEQDENN